MKFLIITRHYPPEVSGGARRPYLYAQALRKMGHSVKLITPFFIENDKDAIQVRHPVSSISDQSEDQQIATVETEQNCALRSWARQWLCWPEPDIRWARKVRQYVTKNPMPVDWVITTSPPESLHCIGAHIAKSLEAKWLAESRDTWITNPHRKILETSSVRQFAERQIARKSFSKVDAVTAVSEAVMADIRQLIPASTPECIIGHFSAPAAKSYTFENTDLNLVHAGGFTLSDRRRKIDPLLRVIQSAKRSDIHLHILGPLSPDELEKIDLVRGFKVSSHGRVPFEKSRAMQQAADGLVLCTPANSHALPGKFAEYLTTGKPILFLGGGDWIKLVDDPRTIAPLTEGIKTVRKWDESRIQFIPRNSAAESAKKLSEFCENLL